MSRQLNFIDRLFLKMSYTFKLKLALGLGFFPCVIILVLAYFLQFKPIADIQYQQTGASFLFDSTRVVSSILNYYRSEKKDETERHEIDDALIQLKKRNEIWKGLNLYESLTAKVELLEIFWKEMNLKDNKMSTLESLKGILDSYIGLTEDLGVLSRLVLSQDISTGFLVTALCDGLPESLHYISLNFGSENPVDKHFAVINEVVFSNLNTAIETNAIYKEPPGYEKSQEALKEYRKAIFKIQGSHEVDDTFQAADRNLKLIMSLTEQLQEALSEQTITLGWFHFWTINWIILGGGLVFAIYFMRITRRPLEYLKDASEEMSKGNLSVRVPITTQDEVAEMTEAFNRVAEFFESILFETVKIIHRLTQASGNIIDNAQQMDKNINSLEMNLRNISSFSERFKTGMQEFEENLKSFCQTAGLADNFAITTTRNLQNMEGVMEQMILASRNIVGTLSNLQSQVDKINNLILTIVNIADQSNLLSVNTAIRANKSGNQGRGFVIIADRIREMADKIAFAALDIEKVVNEIVMAVQKNVAEVNKFSDQINLKVGETRQISDQLNTLIKDTQVQLNSFSVIQEGVAVQTNEFSNINASLNRLYTGAELTSYSARRLLTDIEFLHDSCKGLSELTKKFDFTQSITEKRSSDPLEEQLTVQ